jgi:hypothetical protein
MNDGNFVRFNVYESKKIKCYDYERCKAWRLGYRSTGRAMREIEQRGADTVSELE